MSSEVKSYAKDFQDRMQATLTSTLDLFADKLFIKHAPLMHQEGFHIACPTLYYVDNSQ